jgi:hypothetical protein
MWSKVVLPEPDIPITASNSPELDDEIDALQDVEYAPRDLEGTRDAGFIDGGHVIDPSGS